MIIKGVKLLLEVR